MLKQILGSDAYDIIYSQSQKGVNLPAALPANHRSGNDRPKHWPPAIRSTEKQTEDYCYTPKYSSDVQRSVVEIYCQNGTEK